MRQLQSDQVDKIIPAFAKAQKSMGHAIKDKKNSHLQNEYATLEANIDAVKDHLLANDIVVLQPHQIDEGGNVFVVTTLIHTSGQWFRSYTPVLMEKKTCQSMGSGLSYARRYALSAMCFIGQADDDGNMASGNVPKGESPKAAQAPRASAIRRAENPQCCGQNMMSDKFTKGAFYCPKCGKKQSGGVA